MNIRHSIPWTLALLMAAAGTPASAQLRVPSLGGASSSAPSSSSASSASAPLSVTLPTPRPGEPQLVDRVVAVVNSEAITERELQDRVGAISRRLRSQGVNLPPESELQRQVLERMITERAAIQAAREAGVRVDDVALDRAIARIAGEQKLTVPQLRQRLESEGTPFASFRQEIATELTIGRLREREIESKIQVSEAEIDAYLAEQASAPVRPAEYNIAQIVVRVPEGAPADAVESARQRAESIAREARGGADLERLASAAAAAGGPDSVSGGIIGMRAADRLPPVFVQAVDPLKPGQVAPVVRSPAGFHVLKLLERRDPAGAKAASAPVKQTRARHILVRINELNPENEVVRRLTEIRQRIEGGTVTFADMARQYSSDGSASQGGDLGWVYPGDTVPEFERAMDGLEPGQIAGPVQTPFGYHLIQVTERRTDEASPERVRAAARNALRERKAAEAYQEWISQIRDRAYVELRLDER
jgi:peptidyl-prolyl cis-trans isomerase SurA